MMNIYLIIGAVFALTLMHTAKDEDFDCYDKAELMGACLLGGFIWPCILYWSWEHVNKGDL